MNSRRRMLVGASATGGGGGSRGIYGFELDTSNSDPSASVTYIEDNASYAPAGMNYELGTFDYGDWSEDAFFMPTPVMLGFDGTEICELDPSDYTKDVNGNPSGVDSFDTQGNAMMRWPVMWVSRTWDDGKYQFRLASEKVDDTYQCWANTDSAGETVPFYTPIYFGSRDSSNKLRSISGQSNSVSTTAEKEVTYARNNGSGWHTERVVDRWLINDLLVLLSKTLDSQTAYGRGRTASSNSSAVSTGTMDTRGLFWGDTGGVNGVKVFGMEHWWGNLYRRVAGWVLVSGTQKVKLTEGTQDGSTRTGYNLTGVGYVTLSGSAPAGSSGGFISGYVQTPYGLVPKTASGSETTYACDQFYYDTSNTKYAVVGGVWDTVGGAGAFFAGLDSSASVSRTNRGAAPSYK